MAINGVRVMTNSLQLSLFSNYIEPPWDEINIEWLFNYLKNNFPEMKFQIEKTYSWDDIEEFSVTQTLCKKVRLSFHISRYCESVTRNPRGKFVGINSQKLYGSWGGTGETCDNMEEFKRICALRVKECKEDNEKYKEWKKSKVGEQ